MWEHALPLSKTPIPARDSTVHHATRVTRLIDLDCNRIAIIKIDNGIDFLAYKSFTFQTFSPNATERRYVYCGLTDVYHKSNHDDYYVTKLKVGIARIYNPHIFASKSHVKP